MAVSKVELTIVRTLFISTAIVSIILASDFLLPSTSQVCESLLQPGAYIGNKLPGGLIHSPISILVALAIQIAMYGLPVSVVLFMATRLRSRRSSADH